jgi:hypothetical protein
VEHRPVSSIPAAPAALLCDGDHISVRRQKHHVSLVRIDLDFDLMTLDGEVFPARRLLGRPTILVLLRYLG